MIPPSIVDNLTEEEWMFLLYFFNEISKVSFTKEINEKNFKALRYDVVVFKLISLFDKIDPKGYSIYSSILNKFNIKHEIDKENGKLNIYDQ